MNKVAYLSLGSNIGDRENWLKEAVLELDRLIGVKVEKVSSIYETAPVGYTDQDPFLNIAVQVTTLLSAHELLTQCLSIEEKLGRVREIRWGPRKIDLDILLYNNENIEMEDLQIPHPRMTERAFVLVPLLEIDENVKLPEQQYVSLVQVLNDIPDKEGVRLWKQINGEDGFELFEN